jgi:hypothetical protein
MSIPFLAKLKLDVVFFLYIQLLFGVTVIYLWQQLSPSAQNFIFQPMMMMMSVILIFINPSSAKRT